MVRFEEDKYIIEIDTLINPIEEWRETVDELIEVLCLMGADCVCGKVYFRTLGLLRNMMPELDDAKKMAIKEP